MANIAKSDIKVENIDMANIANMAKVIILTLRSRRAYGIKGL